VDVLLDECVGLNDRIAGQRRTFGWVCHGAKLRGRNGVLKEELCCALKLSNVMVWIRKLGFDMEGAQFRADFGESLKKFWQSQQERINMKEKRYKNEKV